MPSYPRSHSGCVLSGVYGVFRMLNALVTVPMAPLYLLYLARWPIDRTARAIARAYSNDVPRKRPASQR